MAVAIPEQVETNVMVATSVPEQLGEPVILEAYGGDGQLMYGPVHVIGSPWEVKVAEDVLRQQAADVGKTVVRMVRYTSQEQYDKWSAWMAHSVATAGHYSR